MASPSNNVFLRLHKWAWRQNENFLTESLAVVLEHLLVMAPAVGTRLVSHLTGGFIDLPAEDSGAIDIVTQVEAGEGRPDLEIRSPHRVVWIEVKAESPLRMGQLEEYRVLLNRTGVEHRRLVLLTRYPEEFTTGSERPDVMLRWYKVAEWFEEALSKVGESSEFLVRKFLAFLEARAMTFAHVDKFMPEGVRALSNLMNMLVEAAEACKMPVKKDAAGEYIGLFLEKGNYWIGVYFSEPEYLEFHAIGGQMSPQAAGKLGVGELRVEGKDKYRWTRKVELDSEDTHFFSRSKVGQMEWLQTFLQECLTQSRSITLKNAK